MLGINHFLGSLAVAGMMLAASVQAGATSTAASGGGTGGGAASTCGVRIDRTAAAGVFDIVRMVTRRGCLCVVRTGPASQGGSAEAMIAALRNARSCPNAPLAAAGNGAAGGAGTGGGLSSGLVIGGVVVAGGGLGAALASKKSKSP